MELTVSTSAIDSSRLHLPRRSAMICGGASWCFGPAALWLVLTAAGAGAAQDQATNPAVDAVMRLVPPDAAVVLTFEDLRDQLHAFTSSRFFAALKQLPAVKDWIESQKAQQLLRSRDQIEAVLGTKLNDICDELIGDALVLALRLPPDALADPSQAHGLLLLRARNRAMLARVIQAVNDQQQASGELARLTEREHGGTTYQMREFPPATSRLSEWYVIYPDGTFAFSNSESLVHSVIDRKGRQSPQTADEAAPVRDNSGAGIDRGLADLARFQSVRRRQPAKALARLFIEPRQIERLIAASPSPSKATDARIMAMLKRYLAAVDYAGAALSWNEMGIVLHTVETLDRSKLEPWLARWAGNDLPPDAVLLRVPATTIALASGRLDAPALFEALGQIVPDEDQPKLKNLESVLSGLMLGQDLRNRILPQLGPGILAYVECPPAAAGATRNGKGASAAPNPFAQVLVVSLRKTGQPATESVPTAGGVTTAAAIENALRTVLSLAALDEKRNNGRSQITTRAVAGVNVTTLNSPIAFAYAVDADGSRLIVGTSPSAVARYLEAAANPKAGERFRRLRAQAFPDAETFLCVDLTALDNLAGLRRERLVELLATRKNQPAAQVDRDLSQVLALARLFEAAYFTSRFEPEAAAVHRRIGVSMREQSGK